MKPPAQAPPLSLLLGKTGVDRMRALVGGAGLATEVSGEYVHWDDLRRRKPPTGLSLEEWWLLIQLARRPQRRQVPLADTAGDRFGFVMTDTVLRLVHEVDRDASGRIASAEKVASASDRDRYLFNSLVEEAITSSQLEGAATTRRVAKEMIRSGRRPVTRDERMIFNNYRAMEYIRAHSGDELTPEMVLHLHEIVTLDTLDPDAAGRLRGPNESVLVADVASGEPLHVPPPADQLEAHLGAMCEFANGRLSDSFVHPVVRAIVLHFWLAYDHPFVDGNGRTARAVFYWSMLHEGYWLTEFISISRVIKQAPAQYARAFLLAESDSTDATYFLLQQLRVIRRAIDDLNAYLARKTKEIRSVEDLLRHRDDLNHRQLALLSHALRHPDERYTFESHRRSHKVVYQTARQDLLTLADIGYLVKRKVGRTHIFVAAPRLDEALRGAR